MCFWTKNLLLKSQLTVLVTVSKMNFAIWEEEHLSLIPLILQRHYTAHLYVLYSNIQVLYGPTTLNYTPTKSNQYRSTVVCAKGTWLVLISIAFIPILIDMLSLGNCRDVTEMMFAYNLLHWNIKCLHPYNKMKPHQPTRTLRNFQGWTPFEWHRVSGILQKILYIFQQVRATLFVEREYSLDSIV